MQLGMIGLGRMGANMAMRLMKAGHECMAELSATPPSHPPGEWPTSANERYLLQIPQPPQAGRHANRFFVLLEEIQMLPYRLPLH